MKKNSVLRKAVLPTVLLVGLGSSALVAAPAFADESATDPTAAGATAPTAPGSSAADPAVQDPAPVATASASPTQAPTPAPSAASSSGPTPTPMPTSASDSPTASPTAGVAAAEPTDLTITSPEPDDDGVVVIHGTRTVTISGTAPTGSIVRITNDNDDTLARFATTSSTFTRTLTFAADAPYEQYLYIGAKVGGRWLPEDAYLDLVFDAAKSATPTIEAPASGSSFEIAPLPFGLENLDRPVAFSGTGTPGDDISLYFDKPGAEPGTGFETGNSDFFSFFGLIDEVTVDETGHWSGLAVVPSGASEVTATQARYDADSFGAITVESDYSTATSISVSVPAGTVLPPVLTKPGFADLFPDDPTDEGTLAIGFGSASTTMVAPSAVSPAAIPSVDRLLVDPAAMLAPTATERSVARSAQAESVAAADPADAAVTSDDASDSSDDFSQDPEDLDQEIATSGVQVQGKAAAQAGLLDISVTGTGTPGDGIVVAAYLPSEAEAAFTALYPGLLDAEIQDDGSLGGMTGPVKTNTDLLPVDDHTITVGADGTWTGTVAVKPGPAFLTAFATRATGAAVPTYSVASGIVPINVNGTPNVDPAGTVTSLAYTGSDGGPLGTAGLLALGLGGALLFVGRRRLRPRA